MATLNILIYGKLTNYKLNNCGWAGEYCLSAGCAINLFIVAGIFIVVEVYSCWVAGKWSGKDRRY